MSNHRERQRHLKELVRYAHKFADEFGVQLREASPIHRGDVVGIHAVANTYLGIVDASVCYNLSKSNFSAKKASRRVILSIKEYVRECTNG